MQEAFPPLVSQAGSTSKPASRLRMLQVLAVSLGLRSREGIFGVRLSSPTNYRFYAGVCLVWRTQRLVSPCRLR